MIWGGGVRVYAFLEGDAGIIVVLVSLVTVRCIPGCGSFV